MWRTSGLPARSFKVAIGRVARRARTSRRCMGATFVLRWRLGQDLLACALEACSARAAGSVAPPYRSRGHGIHLDGGVGAA
jgi:hypothetical protein